MRCDKSQFPELDGRSDVRRFERNGKPISHSTNSGSVAIWSGTCDFDVVLGLRAHVGLRQAWFGFDQGTDNHCHTNPWMLVHLVDEATAMEKAEATTFAFKYASRDCNLTIDDLSVCHRSDSILQQPYNGGS